MHPLNTFKSSVFNGFTPRGKLLNRGRKITNSYYPPTLVERYMSSSYKSLMPAGNILTATINTNYSSSNVPYLWINDPKGNLIAQYSAALTNNFFVQVAWDGKYIYAPLTYFSTIYQFDNKLNLVNIYNIEPSMLTLSGITAGKNFNVVNTLNSNYEFMVFDKDFSSAIIDNYGNSSVANTLQYFNGYHYIVTGLGSNPLLGIISDQTGQIEDVVSLPIAQDYFDEYTNTAIAYANNNIYLLTNTGDGTSTFALIICPFPLGAISAYNIFTVNACPNGCGVNILVDDKYVYGSFIGGGELYVFDAYSAEIVDSFATSAGTLAQIGKTTYTSFSDGVNTYFAELDLTTGSISDKQVTFNLDAYPSGSIIIS